MLELVQYLPLPKLPVLPEELMLPLLALLPSLVALPLPRPFVVCREGVG